MNKIKLFVIMSSIIIILLNLFDGYSTAVLLEVGNGEELNPVMHWLMTNFGVVFSLVITKAIVIGMVIWATIKVLCTECLTYKEIFTILLVYCTVIMFYSYFMYFYNLHYFMLL